jgi:DNA-binding NarL/FixJ family response regulator
MKNVTIYLADDHVILRDGLRNFLDQKPGFEIIGEAGDGKTVLEEIIQKKPMVVVLDISLPLVNGIQVARQVKKLHPEIKIIILTRHDDEEYVKQLLKIGIDGYVLKEEAGEDLFKAIELSLAGDIFLSPRLTCVLINEMVSVQHGKLPMAQNHACPLTRREIEVLQLIAEGRKNVEIASILGISNHTVKGHRCNMLKKLSLHNSTSLVKHAIKEKLIKI